MHGASSLKCTRRVQAHLHSAAKVTPGGWKHGGTVKAAIVARPAGLAPMQASIACVLDQLHQLLHAEQMLPQKASQNRAHLLGPEGNQLWPRLTVYSHSRSQNGISAQASCLHSAQCGIACLQVLVKDRAVGVIEAVVVLNIEVGTRSICRTRMTSKAVLAQAYTRLDGPSHCCRRWLSSITAVKLAQCHAQAGISMAHLGHEHWQWQAIVKIEAHRLCWRCSQSPDLQI